MDITEIGGLKRVHKELGDSIEAMEMLAVSRQEAEAAEKRRAVAEEGYRLAHSERAQIIEAIVNLKEQHAKLGQDLNAQYAEAQSEFEKAVAEARESAHEKIKEYEAKAVEAEAEAGHRIEAAQDAAAEAEARVVKAQEALEALKRA